METNARMSLPIRILKTLIKRTVRPITRTEILDVARNVLHLEVEVMGLMMAKMKMKIEMMTEMEMTQAKLQNLKRPKLIRKSPSLFFVAPIIRGIRIDI